MIKVDDGYGCNDFHVEVSDFHLSCIMLAWDEERDRIFLTHEAGMNLAAALVREIHGAREPRVWESADDIPDGVKVSLQDGDNGQAVRYGDFWVYFDRDGFASTWECEYPSPSDYSHFTEVL